MLIICSRVRKHTEQEKRKASFFKLLALLTSMFRRRHFYEVRLLSRSGPQIRFDLPANTACLC